STEVTGKAMRLARKITYVRRELKMQYDFETLTNAVSPADMPQHLEVLKRIRDAIGYSIERPNGTTAPVAANGQTNWIIVALAAIYFLFLIVVAALLYHFRPRKPSSYLEPPPHPALTGIGGW